MNSAGLIFPHQLFENNPLLNHNRQFFLIEEPLFFTQFPFHRQKLVFHRASMKFYFEYLRSGGYDVKYIGFAEPHSEVRKLIPFLRQNNIKEIAYIDVADNWLEKRLKTAAEKAGIKLLKYDSPSFLNTVEEVREFFSSGKSFRQTEFYIRQRKKRHILIEGSDKPSGGKWTYDSENRQKYPRGKKPPVLNFPEKNRFHEEAVEYVNAHFINNYGSSEYGFHYPVTFDDARKWLAGFLKERLSDFGRYQDAIVGNELLMYHSLLSPMINSGLITPAEVISEALKHYSVNKIPINAFEGFIRQIMGWREFVRAVYELKGTEERTKNFWNFRKKIPAGFWDGTTGIDPIDITIKKIIETGYCHHIERLMVLGNFMLLCEFDPDEVYRWFMTMFIDAYDWVMVPNVYGMSQYADGGLMATKPYVSSSNYLLKMSDFPSGPWQEIWDALFWRFISVHVDFFSQNPRLRMMVKNLERMPENRLKKLLDTAERYLQTLE